MKVEYDCIVCGNHVSKIRTPGNMQSPPKYCSQKCHGIDKHNHKVGPTPNIEFHCLNCGKVVATYRSPSARKSFTAKFCSLKCVGIYQSGDGNPSWSGGKYQDQLGYFRVFMPDHPYADNRGYVLEHRLVMEQIVGRFLTQVEVVHHEDENKANNNPDNLVLFKNNSEHMRYHSRKRKQ